MPMPTRTAVPPIYKLAVRRALSDVIIMLMATTIKNKQSSTGGEMKCEGWLKRTGKSRATLNGVGRCHEDMTLIMAIWTARAQDLVHMREI